MGEITGRRIVVTGASRGIGLSIARRLADAGARVAMVARSEAELARIAGEIGAEAVAADVTSAEVVEELPARVAQRLGGEPEVVVNAAGAFSMASFLDTTAYDLERQLAVNLRGPFLVARAFLPAMISRGAGHIVNIGSIAGRVALPGNAGYGASKFGLRGLHEILAAELQGTGVRSTLVEPAATDTSLWDSVDPDSVEGLPARREMLRPEDVARAVAFAIDQPDGVEISLLAVRAVQPRPRM